MIYADFLYDKNDVITSFRYACLLPHAEILFCNIISEFGKRRDLASALKAYELSKKHVNTPNMYLYRAIIDACGLCRDYMKSRYIYEVFSKEVYIDSLQLVLKQFKVCIYEFCISFIPLRVTLMIQCQLLTSYKPPCLCALLLLLLLNVELCYY